MALKKWAIAAAGFLILASCATPPKVLTQAELAPYDGEPYMQLVVVKFGVAYSDGRGKDVDHGSCNYSFGDISGTVQLPNALLKLPMTNRKQKLVLNCKGKTNPIGIFKIVREADHNWSVETSLRPSDLTDGPLTYGLDRRQRIAEREQIMRTKGVQLLPDVIGYKDPGTLF